MNNFLEVILAISVTSCDI